MNKYPGHKSDSSLSIHGVLIAGPSRCGKSQLVSAFNRMENCPLSVLTVDALLPYYSRSSKKINGSANARTFIEGYLQRPRYMDSASTITRKPIDDILYDCDKLYDGIDFKNGEVSLSLIGKILAAWVTQSKKNIWIAPELHAEIYYKKLLYNIPTLKIIVLLRDPREALAATLYWRTFPHRIQSSHRICIHKLLLWCLAASVGLRYSRKSPNKVRVLYSKKIDVVNEFIFTSEKGQDFKVELNYEELHYSFNPNKGLLEPTGNFSFLLTDNELYMIEKIAQPWYSNFEKKVYKVNVATIIVTFFVRIILLISIFTAYFNPVMSKKIIDLLFAPYDVIKKAQNSIKDKLKNNLPQLFALYSKIRNGITYKK